MCISETCSQFVRVLAGQGKSGNLKNIFQVLVSIQHSENRYFNFHKTDNRIDTITGRNTLKSTSFAVNNDDNFFVDM